MDTQKKNAKDFKNYVKEKHTKLSQYVPNNKILTALNYILSLSYKDSNPTVE